MTARNVPKLSKTESQSRLTDQNGNYTNLPSNDKNTGLTTHVRLVESRERLIKSHKSLTKANTE